MGSVAQSPPTQGLRQDDDRDSTDSEPPRPPSPEAGANFLGRLLLTWVFPIVIRGYRNPLSDADVWELSDREQARNTSESFFRALDATKIPTSDAPKTVDDARGSDEYNDEPATDESDDVKVPRPGPTYKPRLVRALFRDNARASAYAFILKAVDIAFGQIQPVILNFLLRWLVDQDAPVYRGYVFAVLLFLAPMLKSVLENQYFLLAMRTGLRVRASVQAALYDKSLRMSPSARAGSSVGQVVNLMQLDAQRLAEVTNFIHVTWAAPVQLLVSLILLFVYIGPSAFIGLLLSLISVPVQAKLIQIAANLRKKNVAITDERVKITNEIFQGMKAVKFYAWERPFAAVVEEIRDRELANYRMSIWARSGFLVMLMAMPTVIAVVTFAFFAAVFKEELDAARIFTGLSILNQLRIPILMFPLVVTSLIDARVAVKRIEHFLNLEDAGGTVSEALDGSEPGSEKPNKNRGAVTVENATFAWDSVQAVPDDPPKKRRKPFRFLRRNKEEGQGDGADQRHENTQDGSQSQELLALRNIDLQAEPGKLTVVIGRVGAGKSSLMHAIIGDMKRKTGSVKMQGTVAYVPQTAWIFNATLKENIVFGSPFDENRYSEAVRVSCLEQDLHMLPAGDLTAIGEKGINLSGGQKARVSLARAVYANADIYLFDDPLSALDSHVGQSVFDGTISKQGVLRRQCRILVTNQLQFVPMADKVVFLENGEVKCQGKFKDLIRENADFARLMTESNTQAEALQSETHDSATESKTIEVHQPKIQHAVTVPAKVDKLMKAEERATGGIPVKTYIDYAKACGGTFLFLSVVLLSCVNTALQILTSWWLSFWSREETLRPGRWGLDFYLGIYVGLALLFAGLTFLRTVWFLILALRASKSVHKTSFWSVIRAPMSFYDTTPIGRIISRFSRDTSAMDQLVPQQWGQFLNTTTNLIGSYILIAVITPIFVAVAIPIGVGYYLLQRFFNRTNLEVKRLDSNSKSPIYSHFSETLGGLSTIRAFNKTGQFKEQNLEKIDTNHRAYFAQIATNRWFALYLELCGSLLVLTAALLVTAGKQNGLFVGDAGLSLTYVLQVTSFLGFAVRSITEMEAQMNAIERLVYYRDELPQEPPEFNEEVEPGKDWPERGAIEFDDVKLRYREELELVLKGINLRVEGGTKVGVVGRTGAGKSSLMVALLRLVDYAEGSIKVDGHDLGSMGLNDIRSRITIIPQDAVLFSGTLRFNLDPFKNCTDDQLWRALDKAHLKEFVSSTDGGLDSMVSEYGENLSAGQRQLLCLARALLRNPRVLILDEATSSVDYETDQLIQRTIRHEFDKCTILTIAHRLWTIADYDRILVMESGLVAEYGSPNELLENKEGHLSFLVDALGEVGSANFRKLAAERNKAMDILEELLRQEKQNNR